MKSNLSCDDDYKLLSKCSSKHVNIRTLGILRSFEGRGRKSSPALPRTASPFITICKISFAGNRLGLMLPTKTIVQSGKQWTIFSSPSPSPPTSPSPPAGWRLVLRSQPGDCCHPSSSSPPSIIAVTTAIKGRRQLVYSCGEIELLPPCTEDPPL